MVPASGNAGLLPYQVSSPRLLLLLPQSLHVGQGPSLAILPSLTGLQGPLWADEGQAGGCHTTPHLRSCPRAWAPAEPH